MSDTDSQVYSRIYHRLMNEYPALWRSDAQLALFVRLLVLADKFWPEHPPLPRSNGTAMRSLIDAGVISVDDSDNFRVRGLDAERNRRSTAARNAARSRYAVRDALPSKDEKRKEETSNGASGPTSFIGMRPRKVDLEDIERQHAEAFAKTIEVAQRKREEKG